MGKWMVLFFVRIFSAVILKYMYFLRTDSESIFK